MAHHEQQRCPKCGFSYTWDGVHCSHCKLGVTSADTEAEPSEAPHHEGSNLTGLIIGGLIGVGLVVYCLGWTTFITIVLWSLVVIGALGAVGFGLYASNTEDDDEKAGSWIGVGVAAVVALGSWLFMPGDQTPDRTTDQIAEHAGLENAPSSPLSVGDLPTWESKGSTRRPNYSGLPQQLHPLSPEAVNPANQRFIGEYSVSSVSTS